MTPEQMTPEQIIRGAQAGSLDLLPVEHGGRVVIAGHDPVLPARCRIGEVASLALAEVGDAAAELAILAGSDPGLVETSVEDGAQAVVSFGLMRVDGEAMPRTNQSNPFVRAYPCRDGRWIYLHGGFPHLQLGLTDLLKLDPGASFDVVGQACENWDALELEDEAAHLRLCAGMFRTGDEWSRHPHGQAVTALPTVVVTDTGPGELRWAPGRRRPLDGLRVLDLTRVLAGPTCGRTLAALGADVLQVTGPDVPHVPAFVVDTGHGKRRAHADLRDRDDRRSVCSLALTADVIVQGQRPGTMGRHGLDAAALREAGFRGIYANVSAYGPVGPFSQRAGWEQLAQAVAGIGLHEGTDGRPKLLPAAACDYTTGLRLAGAIVRALATGRAIDLDASLCQTAAWILGLDPSLDPKVATGFGSTSLEEVTTDFGTVHRLGPGFRVQGLDVSWSSGSTRLGSASLSWREVSSSL